MSTRTSAIERKPAQEVEQENPFDKLHRQLVTRKEDFEVLLPKNMKFEFFKGVIAIACQKNPDLLKADRASLITAALEAAHDGLLPDGREGAMVIYNTKVTRDGKEAWIQKVQWMPMIEGIRKKVRNTKELLDWQSVVVHQRDTFYYRRGLEPRLDHEPYQGADDPGPAIAAYSIAKLVNGEVTFEVMNVFQIEKIRARSKAAKSGPWVTDYDEMCRKTVCRRHRKELPLSAELQVIIQRDDILYDVDGTATETPERPKLGDFSKKQLDAPKKDDVDMTPRSEIKADEMVPAEDSTGNGKTEEKTADKGTAAETTSAKPASGSVKVGVDKGAAEGDKTTFSKVDHETGEVSEYGPADAMQRGRDDHAAGKARKALPPEFRTPDKQTLAEAWEAGWDDANEITKPAAKAKLI